MEPVENQEPLLPPGSLRWISEELLKDTLRVLGPRYEQKGIKLTPADAVEILMNVSNFGRVLGTLQVQSDEPNDSP